MQEVDINQIGEVEDPAVKELEEETLSEKLLQDSVLNASNNGRAEDSVPRYLVSWIVIMAEASGTSRQHLLDSSVSRKSFKLSLRREMPAAIQRQPPRSRPLPKLLQHPKLVRRRPQCRRK